MEKSIFEQMGGTYHQEGDYLLPDLTPPEITPIGVWGQRHKRYLKAIGTLSTPSDYQLILERTKIPLTNCVL